ncbi:hypothetical protein [Cesiribacter sp. SM1]|uniref:hypothetical protein n=1 Tax=Cesiribacter sp. SM1 TaxID=2861196 RepID=UPI001CD7F926|nr:hypothetical protein [Cesiribacter sp. SM1]
MVPLVHRHSETLQYSSVTLKDKQVASKGTLQKFLVKCDICDFLLNKQNTVPPLNEQALDVAVNSVIVKEIPPYKSGVSELSFFSWTNKGPPQA